MDPIVDSVFQGKAIGDVSAVLLQNDMNWRALRTNGTLQKDEWKRMDATVVQIARSRLRSVGDLLSRGLRYDIANGLGQTVLEFEKISDMNDAEVNMEGIVKSADDRVVYELSQMPLPIVHKGFQISTRVLNSSRTRGLPLDTTQSEVAARKVAEKVESSLFNGYSFTFGSGKVYGLTTYPDRNTGSGTAWTDSSSTGATILAEVLAMKQALIADKYFGPYGLYVPTAYETKLEEDFKANGDLTIRQRLLETDSLEFIQVADYMAAGNVIMVQLTSDVVRIVVGMSVVPVQWKSGDGMMNHFKVMTIMVPQIRSDQEGKCGVYHWTAS